MRRRTPLQHAMDRFTADPSSVRNAAAVMIIITVGIVLVGGLIVWIFDARDFPDLGGALLVHAPDGHHRRVRRQGADPGDRAVWSERR